MLFRKIWERYIFKEFIKFFLFFLFGFYFFYILVDYSTHVQDFAPAKNVSLSEIVEYYLFQFIKRADILLPLALLLGTIKVLCQLNTHKELVAFQMAGLSAKKLLRPFLFLGILCTLSNAALMEFALPHSLNFLDKFYDAHLSHSVSSRRSNELHVLHLQDQSKLVYQRYDAAKEAFFDVIWIRTPDDLWRMKYLKASSEYPRAKFADHLVRDSQGLFQKSESFASVLLTDLKWQKELPRKGFIPFENFSIQSLLSLLKEEWATSRSVNHEIVTHLLFKAWMPSLAILVILAASPFCLKHSKNLPQFFIYGVAIFGFVFFITAIDAAVILGENNTISPYVAVLSPFIALIGVCGWKFAKT